MFLQNLSNATERQVRSGSSSGKVMLVVKGFSSDSLARTFIHSEIEERWSRQAGQGS